MIPSLTRPERTANSGAPAQLGEDDREPQDPGPAVLPASSIQHPTSAARRSPLEAGVDRIWRFFCSVRMAIYEIAFLALLVLIGTLAGSSVPRQLADLLPITEPLVDRWYAWDVFGSWLFAATLLVIAVAIAIGGMLNRAPGIWRAIAQPTVTTTHGFLRGADPAARIAADRPVDDLVGQLGDGLRGLRYRVLTERRGEETHLYADKNRYGKLGTFPFHTALILVMVGAIVAARYGFRDEELVVNEGTVEPIGHGTGLSVRLDRFSDEYNEDGTARRYASDLALLEGGDEVAAEQITVNDPLTHGDVTVYQAGFGQNVTVRVRDAGGATLFEGPIAMGIYQSRENPDAPAGIQAVPAAGTTLYLIGPDANPYNDADQADPLRLRSSEVYVQALRDDAPAGTTPAAGTVAVGGNVALGGLRVEYLREGRYAVLQVGRNPGLPIFVLASVLLVGGLAVTFYFPLRRVRAIVAPAPGGSVAHLAPMARRDWSGQRDFSRLLGELEGRLGVRAMVRGTGAEERV